MKEQSREQHNEGQSRIDFKGRTRGDLRRDLEVGIKTLNLQ